MSRHGIVATGEEVRKLIFRGLAGGDSEDDCIDLTEVMAILIIPYLVKTVQDKRQRDRKEGDGSFDIEYTNTDTLQDQSLFAWEQKTMEETAEEQRQMRAVNQSIISNVLEMILLDCCGSKNPPPLTKDLLKTIFSYYKEEDLIHDDDLLDEMIEMACGNNDPKDVVLDAETFARAFTIDVIKLYKPEYEFRLSTHFEDAFGLDRDEGALDYVGKARTLVTEEKAENEQEEASFDLSGGSKEESKVRAVATLCQIDFMADNFRSMTQYVVRYVFDYRRLALTSTLFCALSFEWE